MIRDVGQDFFQQAHVPLYDTLQSDLKKPMYPGCTKFAQLSPVLDLVNLKAKYGWSDKSVFELLDVLLRMLPNQNTLLKNHYEATKILCPLGMEYKKYIHVVMIAYCITQNNPITNNMCLYVIHCMSSPISTFDTRTQIFPTHFLCILLSKFQKLVNPILILITNAWCFHPTSIHLSSSMILTK